MKVKSASYVRMHGRTTADVENEDTLAKDPLGFVFAVWLCKEEDEVLAYFPQFLQLHNQVVSSRLSVRGSVGCTCFCSLNARHVCTALLVAHTTYVTDYM